MTQENDKNINLLIADDEHEFAATLVARLEIRNFVVRMVNSGHDALEAIDDEEPDVLLLDLKMPDMDGLEVLARLREHHKDLKVIILTGHGSFEAGREGMELGAYDYLMKPIELGKLIEVVRSACEAS
ncbi:response regulator [Desulfopila sp. IMCC35008]|uniref:response regulator n=1 Tax=Desulfopila sp. IMCC35008 TaxID=2653858 RepID=UPI0013D62691|nr:response regulator [Desulfopila sp. IMCC35008]